MMYRGRPKLYASSSYGPGTTGESVNQFFDRILSKADEEYASVFDPSMDLQSSVGNHEDNDPAQRFRSNPSSAPLKSLDDREPLSNLAQSPCQAGHTRVPATQTSEDHLTCPTNFPDNMSDRARMDFAFEFASQHPDANRPPWRNAESKSNLSIHRKLPDYVADHCKTALSWCEGKSQALGRTRSKVSIGLDSRSNRSHGVFGKTLSRVGSRFEKMWKEHRRQHTSLFPSRVTAG